MRVVIIWREGEGYSRTVSDWLRDFERRTGKQLESYSPDDGGGLSLCRAYDVVEYPTMMALDDYGRLLQRWISFQARGLRSHTVETALL